MSYHHLNLSERGQIEGMLRVGTSKAAIAATLGRNRTTVSRELKRGTGRDGVYRAADGQSRYQENRSACVRPRALDHPPLRDYVRDKLPLFWSPEQISHRLRLEFPYDGWMRVSTEAIYRTLYTDPKWKNAFGSYLRRGRRRRQKRGLRYERRGPIANRVSIEQRPQEVEALTEYGHWEGDTLIGKNQQGAVLTLVERKADLLRAVPLTSRKAEEVAQAIRSVFASLPSPLRKTITFDNGSEFALHEAIARDLSINVYFAHPYSSFERGRIENANGLLRQYLPKSMTFSRLSSQHLAPIVNELNDRPRKKQAYRTPNEVFQKLLWCT